MEKKIGNESPAEGLKHQQRKDTMKNLFKLVEKRIATSEIPDKAAEGNTKPGENMEGYCCQCYCCQCYCAQCYC